MSPTTATTTAPASLDAGAAAPLADGPQYYYAGAGRFLPANEQAREECRRFNAWADDVNARASTSARQ